MTLSREFEETTKRFKVYIDRLIALFKQHRIDSIQSLIQTIRRDKEFSSEWTRTWREIADADGGKLSLTTVGVVLGSALGGVGIAAMGGAIGLPLALVLGLGGLVVGTEFDAVRRISRSRWTLVKVPKDVYSRIKEAAETAGLSVNDIVAQALTAAFPDPRALESDD